MREPHIEIDGVRYRRFIPYPEPVTDGTVRCFFCGQIDEPRWHVAADCREVQRTKAYCRRRASTASPTGISDTGPGKPPHYQSEGGR